MTPEDLGPGLKELARHTDEYGKFNRELDKAQRRERGSLPPSEPKQPVAQKSPPPPVVLTADRARVIAKALKNNHTLLTLVALVSVEDGESITPLEFQAFCSAAVRSLK